MTGQDGIEVHFARALHRDDVVVRDGIPATSVARTLLDCAEVTSARQLERAWDQAERLELLDLGALEALVARSRGRRGLRPLRELIARATRPEPTHPFMRFSYRRVQDHPDEVARVLSKCLEAPAIITR